MSWIEEIDEEDAEGDLKEVYEEIVSSRGKLSNIMKVHSLNPGAMKAHMDMYMSVMFEDRSLPRKECEMIGVVVSEANGCSYCVNHHAEALKSYWEEERVQALKEGMEEVELDDREEKVVEYAYKLTVAPEKMGEEDVGSLREAGLKDEEVLNVNLVVSYFNFVNRIALGLGVPFTEEEVEGYKY